ncbi:MAG: NAD(P)-dependent oxidoreductase [Candidatus Dormiibacterota bacterium]
MTDTAAPFRIAWLEDRPENDLELARSLLPETISIDLLPLVQSGHVSTDQAELLGKADALLVQRTPVTDALLEVAAKARLVQLYGVRDEVIDRESAERRGVTVAVMPMRGCIAVAELAMTLVLALSKQLIHAHQVTADGAYRGLGLEPIATTQTKHAFQWMKLPGIFEVSGTTLGIIGLGEIGTELAQRARAFGMRVLYNKRSRLPWRTEQALGVDWRERAELLGESDFVVLALPYSEQVHNLIGTRELAQMKRTAFLVNVARGPLIDESALLEALDARLIAGAGLDVFVEEPLRYDNPLARSDRVILTPHIGGGSGGAREKQLSDVLGNIALFANTGRAQHAAPIGGGVTDGRN